MRKFTSLSVVFIAWAMSTYAADHALGVFVVASEMRPGLRTVKNVYGEVFFIGTTPSLDERDVRRVEYVPQGNDGPTIRLVFTEKGATRFRELTNRHLHERIVFMIGGRVAMVPVIDSAATTDYTLITGNVTRKDAEVLAAAIPGPSR